MLGSMIKRFIQDESGQGIIEYAGVLAFAAGLIVVLTNNFNNVKNALQASFTTIVNDLGNMNAAS